MAEPQPQTDEFTLYGILSDFNARGLMKYEDFRSIVQDNLQMQPYFALIMKILDQEHNIKVVDKLKIDLRKIFSCFESLTFTQEVPRFLNGRQTFQNIRIVKASLHLFQLGLLTAKDIKDATLIFQLREMELMNEGLPLDATTINGILWAINKALSAQVLEEWIKRCSEFLQVKGYIQAFEFLYLMANTVDRQAYFHRIPKATLDLTKDPKYNLYKVDTTGFKTLKNPDSKIQNYMNYQFNVDKAVFEGRSLNDRGEHYQQKRIQKHQQFLNNKNASIGDFKKALRDPELYVEIRNKLKHAQQIINHSKLNGKMLRVQLMEEFASSTHIQQIKEQPQYQKTSQSRPLSGAISAIRTDVEQHKKMVQDSGFVTQFMQRATSAVSVGTTRTRTTKMHNNSSQFTLRVPKQERPLTGQQASCRKIITNRPQTAISNNNRILDEELSNFESIQDNTTSESKFVFYGSTNSTKRLYSINLPWNKQ